MSEKDQAARDAVFERIKMRSGMSIPKYAFNRGWEARTAHSAHRISELEEALREAVETIYALHGDVGWAIYRDNSPEMKRITAALAGGSRS